MSTATTLTVDAYLQGSEQLIPKRIRFVPARRRKKITNDIRGKYRPEKPILKSTVEPESAPQPSHYLYPPNHIDKWLTLPVKPIGAGLQNFGNTCFANSTLQCLSYVPPLQNYLLQSHHTDSCSIVGFCALCEMQKLVGFVLKNPRGVVVPRGILRNLRAIGRQFHAGRQEDAHEFTRYLVDALQRSCLRGMDSSKLESNVAQTTLIGQIFSGQFQSQVKCLKCGFESNTFDPFMDLSLEIASPGCGHSLQRVLEHFCRAERLDGDNKYRCSECKELVPADKRMLISQPPSVLCIQLKRFDFIRSSHANKISKAVQYPLELDLSPNMDTTKKPVKYDLCGVLVHKGQSTHSGHYFSFCKGGDGLWYCLDDEMVRMVGTATVLSQQAYVLFYVKQAQMPLSVFDEGEEREVEKSEKEEIGDEKRKKGEKRGNEEKGEERREKKRKKREKKEKKREKKEKKREEKEREKREREEKEKSEREDEASRAIVEEQLAELDTIPSNLGAGGSAMYELAVPTWEGVSDSIANSRQLFAERTKKKRRSAYDEWYDAGKKKKKHENRGGVVDHSSEFQQAAIASNESKKQGRHGFGMKGREKGVQFSGRKKHRSLH